MVSVFASAAPIFLIILLGSILKRAWLTSEEFWRGLEKLNYFVLFPTVLFYGITQATLKTSELSHLILSIVIATSIISICLLIAQKIMKSDKILFTSLFQGSIRYNNFIFLGLVDTFYGSKSLSIAALIIAYMIIFTNILTIFVYTKYTDNVNETLNLREQIIFYGVKFIKNPLIFSSMMALIGKYFDLQLNIVINNFLKALADGALVTSVLCIGAGLKFAIQQRYLKYVATASLIKLLIMPCLTVLVMWLFDVKGLAREIGIVFSCLPTASSSYVMSRQMGGDPESMASIITVSTIISVLSLSLIMYIFI